MTSQRKKNINEQALTLIETKYSESLTKVATLHVMKGLVIK